MKRFVTYLYVYKDGKKIKNVGYIRVNVHREILDMQVNIKDADLNNVEGIFYILIKKEEIRKIPFANIRMKEGQYHGRITWDCKVQPEENFRLENIVGICISYENGWRIASCWKDGEEELVAEICFADNERQIEKIAAASMNESEAEGEQFVTALEQPNNESESEWMYRKISLNEIHGLPSSYWHFSNNSFLLHGFWNYGYLVLKENMEKDYKEILLGIPGVYEQPEMVMATCFGFPKFETLPLQVEEVEIGQCYSGYCEQKNQQPEAGTFGCWFTDL